MSGLLRFRALLPRQMLSPVDTGLLVPSTVRYFAVAPNQMALIKQLREQTGAPIVDVKSALQTSDWDIEKASTELRKKGLAAASKKASRRAAEGLVGLASSHTAAAVVEINSETDFVARNDQFKGLMSRAAAAVLSLDTAAGPVIELAALESAAVDGGCTLGEAVADVAGTVRENIRLRRGFRLEVPPGSAGVVGTYLHAAVAPGMGRIASMVLLEHPPAPSLSPEGAEAVRGLAHELAMHAVGAVPRYLSREEVPAAALDAERAVLTEQAARSGKPAGIVDKMVQGRMSKFYEDACLLEQPFIMDDKKKVKEVVAAAGKEAGVQLSLTRFLRVQVGEGLEEEAGKKDFAAEVAEMAATR